MSDWKPEVGQEGEVFNHSLDAPQWEKAVIDFIGEHITVYSSESCKERTAHNCHLDFRPIKTEADKQRDEQIKKIMRVMSEAPNGIWRDAARKAYDNGCRIIAPDEYVAKKEIK